MIQSIYIENYTLISKLSVDFHQGFSAIIGETGAGKSMLIGALSFLLGQRADTNVVKDTAKKTTVEAVFHVHNPELDVLLDTLNIDKEDNCLIRRELTSQGKSRSFVNDTPIALADLKKITPYLLDIHAQHSNILLQNPEFQLLVIDQYAHIESDLKAYQDLYNEYKNLCLQYQKIKDNGEHQDIAYLEYILQEINALHLQQGEQEQLEEKLHQITHIQDIQTALNDSVNMLAEYDINAIELLNNCKRKIETIEKYGDKYATLLQRINSQLIELNDTVDEMTNMAEKTVFNEEELQYVTDRLNAINRLEKKHQLNSIDDLLAFAQTTQTKIDEYANMQSFIKDAEQKIKDCEQHLKQKATLLSQKRKRVIPEIEKAIAEQLYQMNLREAKIAIGFEKVSYDKFGIDKPVFLFNANPGMPMQQVEKIASGGELSRLMLAIKSLIIKKNVLPTIIFDEIDTGVSGEVSAKMGKVMKNISQYCQVIAITHLPQIAAKADYNYLIYKNITDNQTETQVKMLEQNEKIYEIAKMISNEEVTESSLSAAQNLING